MAGGYRKEDGGAGGGKTGPRRRGNSGRSSPRHKERAREVERSRLKKDFRHEFLKSICPRTSQTEILGNSQSQEGLLRQEERLPGEKKPVIRGKKSLGEAWGGNLRRKGERLKGKKGAAYGKR